MKILLTGCFGNIGLATLHNLVETGHEVVAFDLPTKGNLQKSRRFMRWFKRKKIHPEKITLCWGDILSSKKFETIIRKVDVVIHLAGIIPNLSEINPRLATKVNVGGTSIILENLKRSDRHPKLVFASSVTVHGPTMHLTGPLTFDYPYNPTNHYAKTKMEAEKLIRNSGIDYVILRFTATLDPNFSGMLKMENLSHNYEIPMDQRIEFLDTRDAALALTHASEKSISRRIFLIGGGSTCQMYHRDFIGKLFKTLGIGNLPLNLFKRAKKPEDWYTMNWLDTGESEKWLDFQKHSFAQFLEEVKIRMRSLRGLIITFRPIVRSILIRASPYRKQRRRRVHTEKPEKAISVKN